MKDYSVRAMLLLYSGLIGSALCFVSSFSPGFRALLAVCAASQFVGAFTNFKKSLESR